MSIIKNEYNLHKSLIYSKKKNNLLDLKKNTLKKYNINTLKKYNKNVFLKNARVEIIAAHKRILIICNKSYYLKKKFTTFNKYKRCYFLNKTFFKNIRFKQRTIFFHIRLAPYFDNKLKIAELKQDSDVEEEPNKNLKKRTLLFLKTLRKKKKPLSYIKAKKKKKWLKELEILKKKKILHQQKKIFFNNNSFFNSNSLGLKQFPLIDIVPMSILSNATLGLKRDFFFNSIVFDRLFRYLIKKGFGLKTDNTFFNFIKLIKRSFNINFFFIFFYLTFKLSWGISVIKKKKFKSIFYIPVPLSPMKRYFTFIRTLIVSLTLLKNKKIKFSLKLFFSFFNIFKKESLIYSNRTQTYQIIRENRPFSHYRWFPYQNNQSLKKKYY